jgi:hypothetical protein
LRSLNEKGALPFSFTLALSEAPWQTGLRIKLPFSSLTYSSGGMLSTGRGIALTNNHGMDSYICNTKEGEIHTCALIRLFNNSLAILVTHLRELIGTRLSNL